MDWGERQEIEHMVLPALRKVNEGRQWRMEMTGYQS